MNNNRFYALISGALFLLLSACNASPASPTPTLRAPTATINLLTPTPASFSNPVLDLDFPDPDVLFQDDSYYAYATNGNSRNVQAARSTSLVEWELLSDVLPERPTWVVSDKGYVWAPEVFQTGQDAYVMYFVDRYQIGEFGGTQCIGVAGSNSPEGPFYSPDAEPFICQTGQGGSIDPSMFLDEDGQRYVLWKNDGNSGGGQSWLYIQKVSDDGITLEGDPIKLITADQVWEGVLVEAPTLWKQNDMYYLFYSANAYNSPNYAVGYAVSDKITGPYTKPAKQPLLKSSMPAGVVGPGGQDIVTDFEGETWIIFHGWRPDGFRALYLAPLNWEDGEPVVEIKGRDPIPVP